MATELYPFDPTGTNPLCRVVNEQQVVTPVNDQTRYNFIIPFAAPFFSDSFQLTFRNPDSSIRNMVEGVDYYFTNCFISASRATARPVYGSIQFLDRDTSGVIRMTYQTIGGNWTLDMAEIAEIIANNVNNPRITAWEQITDMPAMFPVIDHEWNLDDMVGAKEIVESLSDIAEAILTNTGGGLAAHVGNMNNPHNTTKVQVGLGSVENYPIASQVQAQAGTNNTTYMTPLRTKEAIAALSGDLVATHANNQNNPHNVTKAQVGLGNVGNYGMASQADAVAGTSQVLYLSPFALKAVSDLIRSELAAHADDKTNPHVTDSTQVGLWNVQNYQIATAQEAQAGTANDKYMTPLRVAQAVAVLAGQNMAVHTNDKNNPHETTKAQVGLGSVENYGIASAVEAISSVVGNKYMTPAGTALAIANQVGDAFLLHLNAENPHNVNKDQVGLGEVQNFGIASTEEATEGLSNSAYMTPLRTRALVNQMTFEHFEDMDNPHQTTAEQVGAYTKEAVDTALDLKLDKTGTAANAALLGGRTVADIIAEAGGSGGSNFAPMYRQGHLAENTASTSPYTWVQLAIIKPRISNSTEVYNGALWFVAGGEAEEDVDTPLYQIQIGITPGATVDPVYANVTRITEGDHAEHAFYYVHDELEQSVAVYMRLGNGSMPLTLTLLHDAGEESPLEFLEDVEPTGTTQVPVTNQNAGLAAEFAQFKQDTEDQFAQITAAFVALTQAIEAMA